MTKEALKLALDFVVSISPAFICEATHHKKNERHADNEPCPHVKKQKQIYEAIKEALAQPEQEPVAWRAWVSKFPQGTGSDWVYVTKPIMKDRIHNQPLYTTPPQRTWVGLTDEEINDCISMSIQKTCRTVEAKLKEKNT